MLPPESEAHLPLISELAIDVSAWLKHYSFAGWERQRKRVSCRRGDHHVCWMHRQRPLRQAHDSSRGLASHAAVFDANFVPIRMLSGRPKGSMPTWSYISTLSVLLEVRTKRVTWMKRSSFINSAHSLTRNDFITSSTDRLVTTRESSRSSNQSKPQIILDSNCGQFGSPFSKIVVDDQWRFQS